MAFSSMRSILTRPASTPWNRVQTIESFLRNSNWCPVIRAFRPQGSWAHSTIIKPPDNKPFDADLLVFVDPVVGWTAAAYVVSLRAVFRASDRYRELASMSTRCATLTYAGDFRLDIVPCVLSRIRGGTLEVCNRNDNIFEPTSPLLYTEWLAARNEWTGSNQLQKAIRLLKYLRDIKGTFSVKSILLTTLVGGQVNQMDAQRSGELFVDLPSTLRLLVARLDNFLQSNKTMPRIINPVLPTENFNRHWDQEKYKNFQSKIHQYREWIDDAYAEADRDESVAKWRRIFGDGFAEDVVAEQAIQIASKVLGTSIPARDIVEAVSKFGPAILGRIPHALPHVQRPTWRMPSSGKGATVRISASQYRERNGNGFGRFASGSVVPKHRRVLFQAMSTAGLPFTSSEYDVFWRVVNTDREGANAGQLRGGFYASEPAGCRWESTLYRGAHWGEAFVIRKRDRVCIGKSDRFFVVIGGDATDGRQDLKAAVEAYHWTRMLGYFLPFLSFITQQMQPLSARARAVSSPRDGAACGQVLSEFVSAAGECWICGNRIV
jgi:hypothetical protein